MKNKFEGCILGLAIADSMGYPVEFLRDYDAIESKLKTFPYPKSLFSDDTQMSLCVTKALVNSRNDHDLFMNALAKYFVAWFETQKEGSADWRAPGNTCLAGCENLATGSDWRVSGIDSKGCGSAMRSAPIGLYHYDDMLQVIEWARDSSIITHANPVAVASAAATSLLTFLAVNDVPVGLWAHELKGPLSGVSALPGNHDPSLLPGSIPPPRDELMEKIQLAADAAGKREDPHVVMSDDGLGESWLGHEAVASALFCAMSSPNDYRTAVLTAAKTIGDSDSIACITGAIMGAKLGIEGIPEDWIDAIEAKEALFGLANELFSATQKQKEVR